MCNSTVLFISLRYIFGNTIDRFNRCIYWVSIISIALSISIMIIISSIINGFERILKQHILFLTPHIIVTTTKGYTDITDIPNFNSNSLLNEIIYMKPLIMTDVILQSSKQQISCNVMLGINPIHFEPLFKYLMYDHVQLQSGQYFCIIGSKLAKHLAVNINDQIRLTIPSANQVTPIGYFPNHRLFTVSNIYISNNECDSCYILVNKDDAANLMRYPDDCITSWRIWLYNPFNINKFVNSDVKLSTNWIWKDWSEYKSSLFQSLKIEKNIIFILTILIIIISGFNTVAFLMLLIMDKQKEIAILRTYGLHRLQIVSVFLIHGLSSSFFGIICGSLLGITITKWLNKILFLFNVFPKTLQLPIEIQYSQILSVSMVLIIFILLIILYPSWKISNIFPAQALHYD